MPGSVVEVGCASGSTTIFLNKYMDAQGITKDYFVIDTFSGFVQEDIAHEVSERGKQTSSFRGFQVNKKEWFDATMKMNGIHSVQSIQADVNTFDLSRLGPISFCLLDVDLYRPVKNSLPPLFKALADGGILIVDDCNPNDIHFDGACQAYKEFCEERGYRQKVLLGKLGIVAKAEERSPEPVCQPQGEDGL